MKTKVSDEWYLPDEDSLDPVGPFTYAEICEKIKTRELGSDNFIWSHDLAEERWFRIFEVEFFREVLASQPRARLPKKLSKGSSQTKKKVKLEVGGPGKATGNELRRYPRVSLEAVAIIHNQVILKEVSVKDISEKGIFIEVDDLEVFTVGEEVNVTFLRHDYFGTISFTAVIMKSLEKDKVKGFGLYFLKLNPQARRKVAEYVVEKLEKRVPEVESA